MQIIDASVDLPVPNDEFAPGGLDFPFTNEREPAPNSVAAAYYAADDELLLDDEFDAVSGVSYAEWNDRLRGEELYDDTVTFEDLRSGWSLI